MSSPAADSDCLFCKIVAGDIPADVVHETDTTLAFHDRQPQAPVHVLVIPKQHQPNAGALVASDPRVLAEVIEAAVDAAVAEGIADTGYRLVANTGADAHQTVFHMHVHVLGGRTMGWPPG